MKEELEEIDIGAIKLVPSDVEIPVNDFPIQTKRSLCANTPENLSLLDRIDAVKVITDIEDNIDCNPQQVCQIAQETIEELQAVFNPLNVIECSDDLFTETISVIDDIIELRKALSEVLMRFDTDPEHYTKEDYFALLRVLYQSLLYLYSINGVLTKEWLSPHSDEYAPTEKLVADTFTIKPF